MKLDHCTFEQNTTRNARMALAVVVAFVAALGFDPAHGQTSGGAARGSVEVDKFTDVRGEWRRAGVGFACVSEPNKRLDTIKRDVLAQILAYACLHMGPFMIGQNAQALRAALGAPHKTVPASNGQTGLVYFLGERDHYPYLVATVANDRIAALQVTGPSAAKGYGFNHVDLGATIATLVQYFGQPNHVEPSEEKDTELWVYGPWPFSFEVRDDHVTSIRINEP
jgi:hypothetical protein